MGMLPKTGKSNAQNQRLRGRAGRRGKINGHAAQNRPAKCPSLAFKKPHEQERLLDQNLTKRPKTVVF